MALKKKFISFKTQANFEEKLADGEISDYSIVYILDTKNIWTHGTYFAGAEALQDILVAGENIDITTEDGQVTISSYDTEYTIDFDINTREFTMTDKEGNVQSILLSDTRNTTGVTLDDANPLYLVGANKDAISDLDLGIINVLSTYTDTSDYDTGTTIEETEDGLVLTYTQEENGKFGFTYYEQGWDATDYYDLVIAYTSELGTDKTITVTIVDDQDNEYEVSNSSSDNGIITIDLTKAGDDFNLVNIQQIIIQLSEPGSIIIDDIEINTDGNYSTGGSVESVDYARTNRSSAYTQNGNVYDKNGKKLINKTELDDAITDALATAGIQYDFVICGRYSGDADPSFSVYYGNTDDLQNILSHLRMSVVRGQDDYDYLDSTRITRTEDGNTVSIDGSDGDLMLTTDTTIYLYTELVEDEDGNELELCGLGLTPFSWRGKEAVGYAPFGMAIESVNCQLTSENTDHIATDDVREQLHSIYNENILGTTDKAGTHTGYKADASGYSTTSLSALNAHRAAQCKNEDEYTSYPYIGLYYRFVEIWLTALYCEMGTRDIHTIDKFGAGDCSISELYVDKDNFYDEAQSASCGYTTVTISNNNHTFSDTNNTRWSTNIFCKTPMHLALRVIDAITKKGNLSYINNYKYTFDIDGNVYNNIDLYNGSNMEEDKSYFQVREVPGARGFSEGVMTGVVIQYVCSVSGNYRYIMKNPTPLYRGVNICPGHLIHMEGLYAGGKGYFYQRDPMKIYAVQSSNPAINGQNSPVIENYEHLEDSNSGWAGWADKINPTASMYAAIGNKAKYSYSIDGYYHDYLCSDFVCYQGTSNTSNLYAAAFGGAANKGSQGRGACGFGRQFAHETLTTLSYPYTVSTGFAIIHLNSKDKPEDD